MESNGRKIEALCRFFDERAPGAAENSASPPEKQEFVKEIDFILESPSYAHLFGLVMEKIKRHLESENVTAEGLASKYKNFYFEVCPPPFSLQKI